METKYIDTPEWDKTFALSDKVNHKKVSFTNRYSVTCTYPRARQRNCLQSPSAVLTER